LKTHNSRREQKLIICRGSLINRNWLHARNRIASCITLQSPIYFIEVTGTNNFKITPLIIRLCITSFGRIRTTVSYVQFTFAWYVYLIATMNSWKLKSDVEFCKSKLF
jgi:hypothetical protein